METKRMNGRYEIIESVKVNADGIEEYVIGATETEWGIEYVTWAYNNGSYFWGHYQDLDDLLSARIDLLHRAHRELVAQKEARDANAD